uniref:Uncharacterized protein n=1 Tax=Arundo donax TaxID=35708 RepID=A0A0A9FZ40_ARUDO
MKFKLLILLYVSLICSSSMFARIILVAQLNMVSSFTDANYWQFLPRLTEF